MKEYLDLVRLVLDNGVRKPSRTGIDTLSYFGAFYKVDLAAGFPLLTSKKVNFKSCLHELLWYLSGEDHIRNLRKVTKIWDAWADEKGDLETAYGRYWRRFPHPVQKAHSPLNETGEATAQIEEIDQIQYIINEIRRNPFSRHAWSSPHGSPATLKSASSRHATTLFAFNVTPDAQGNPWKLNCHLTQRSGDIALGIPFNLACYATLTQMLAQEVQLEVGQFAHTIIDAHVYCADVGSAMAPFDHVAGLREQLTRTPRPLPRLTIAKKPFSELKFEDFKVEGYDPHPGIVFKVAV